MPLPHTVLPFPRPVPPPADCAQGDTPEAIEPCATPAETPAVVDALAVPLPLPTPATEAPAVVEALEGEKEPAPVLPEVPPLPSPEAAPPESPALSADEQAARAAALDTENARQQDALHAADLEQVRDQARKALTEQAAAIREEVATLRDICNAFVGDVFARISTLTDMAGRL